MSSASRSVLAFAIRATLDELKRMKSMGWMPYFVDELTLAGLGKLLKILSDSPPLRCKSGASVSHHQPMLEPSEASSPDAVSLIHSVTSEGDLTTSV